MIGRGIAQRRMVTQHLWGTKFAAAPDVVAWLGAMQAQELAYAKWSVAQRADDVDLAMVDRALADGTILRTHILRPTWHFVLPADIRWMQVISAPRVHAINASYYRKFDLDHSVFTKCERLLVKALDGEQLTRREIAGVLERAGIAATGIRLAYILMHAELDAVICSGATKGKQQTYASFDERVPPAKPITRDNALVELTRRYFTSRGPATAKDFARWASLTLTDARSGVEMIAVELECEVVDDRTYWSAASPRARRPRVVSPTIDLVQGYDEVIMSYSESKDILRVPGTSVPGPAPFMHAILLDGHVVGHWRRPPGGPKPRTASIAIETSLYRPLERAEAASLDAAVESYRRFSSSVAE